MRLRKAAVRHVHFFASSVPGAKIFCGWREKEREDVPSVGRRTAGRQAGRLGFKLPINEMRRGPRSLSHSPFSLSQSVRPSVGRSRSVSFAHSLALSPSILPSFLPKAPYSPHQNSRKLLGQQLLEKEEDGRSEREGGRERASERASASERATQQANLIPRPTLLKRPKMRWAGSERTRRKEGRQGRVLKPSTAFFHDCYA